MLPTKKEPPTNDKTQDKSTPAEPASKSSGAKLSDSRRTVLRPAVLTSGLVEGEDKLIDAEWFKRRRTTELVDIMSQIVDELKSRSESSTGVIAASGEIPSFAQGEELQIKEFVRLPAAEKSEGKAPYSWRIVLVSPIEKYEPLGLDLNGDITIGRSAETKPVDLDLTKYNAEAMGVSREHALLRPTKDQLMLVDTGSTNGTFCNGERVRLGMPVEVKDDDIITFGALHFKIKILKRADDASTVTREKPNSK
jgi:FHA domain